MLTIDDQAGKLRRLMGQARSTRTIAVVSGKGGVGKSNVSLNLAILMSAAGNKVALVDADLGLANLDVLMDINIHADISHVVGGSRTMEDVLINLPCGVQFVPGASGLSRLAQLSDFQRAQLLQDLSRLESDNDIIIVDCGAGIGPNVVNFASAADQVLVVTSPEPTSIADGYAIIKVLNQKAFRGRISLVVNSVMDRQEARVTHQRISAVARQFLGVEVAEGGYVLSDPKVAEAVRRRQPFVLAFPRSPASRCMAALATKLHKNGEINSRKDGFFRRVANWFA